MKIGRSITRPKRTDGGLHLVRGPKSALAPFEKIRKAVGDKIDIMVEFHSMWQLLPAMTIARALAPFEPSGTKTRSRWTASAR